MRQNTPKPVNAREIVKIVKSLVRPLRTDMVENSKIAPKNVLRRPMISEMKPPARPPTVIPIKYQKLIFPISVIVNPQVFTNWGAMNPKFQLSICSQKYATIIMKNTALWRPVT